MKEMLWINGVPIKSPKSFQPEFNDLDSEETHRNAAGGTNRDRIASDKRKLNCEWGPLTQEEISKILKLIEPEFFKIKYYDPKDGLITKTFYAGPKTIPMLRMKDGQPMWEGLKVNFVEQ